LHRQKYRQKSGRNRSSGQPQGFGSLLQRTQAVANVFVGGQTEQGGAVGDVLSLDGAGEGLILHLLLDPCDLDLVDGSGGLDEGAGGEKPASSSQAKRALSRCDSRGVPE
jgi:hypothetical protein